MSGETFYIEKLQEKGKRPSRMMKRVILRKGNLQESGFEGEGNHDEESLTKTVEKNCSGGRSHHR